MCHRCIKATTFGWFASPSNIYSIGIQWKYRYIEANCCHYLEPPLVVYTVLDRHHDRHAFGESDIQEKQHERFLIPCSNTVANPTRSNTRNNQTGSGGHFWHRLQWWARKGLIQLQRLHRISSQTLLASTICWRLRILLFDAF